MLKILFPLEKFFGGLPHGRCAFSFHHIRHRSIGITYPIAAQTARFVNCLHRPRTSRLALPSLRMVVAEWLRFANGNYYFGCWRSGCYWNPLGMRLAPMSNRPVKIAFFSKQILKNLSQIITLFTGELPVCFVESRKHRAKTRLRCVFFCQNCRRTCHNSPALPPAFPEWSLVARRIAA